LVKVFIAPGEAASLRALCAHASAPMGEAPVAERSPPGPGLRFAFACFADNLAAPVGAL